MIKQVHWKKRLVVALTGGFLALHTVAAFAAPVELSLEDSIALALKNNQSIKMIYADRTSAELDINAAKGATGPSLELEHSDSRSKTNPTTALNPSNYFSNTATLSMNLYTGGTAQSNIEATKLKLKVADLNVEQTKQQVKLDATTAYYTILQAQNTVKVDQETVDQMADHLKNVQAQYAVGTVAKSDVLASQVALANDQQLLTKAQNSQDVAVSSFNNIVGLPLETEVKIKDELNHDKHPLSLEDSIKYAMLHRPEAIQADYNIAINKEALKAAKGGKLPTVTAKAIKGWNDTSFPGTENSTWSIGLTATWTPFDSGVTNSKIKQADSSIVKSIEQAQQTKDSIHLAVLQAYLNMTEADKRINTSQVTVEQAEENLKIAEVRYSAGVGTNTEVIDAQVALTTAKNNYIQAMYDFNTDKATLLKAMGVAADGKL